MPWTEVAPGRFEKPLDPSEHFFVVLNAAPKPPTRERWTINTRTTFKSDMPESERPAALRQAWRTMRYLFPLLGAELMPTKKLYIVPSNAEVESWLDKTVIIESEDADVDEVIAEYKSTPLARIHYFPGCGEIMFHTSHWRTDGTGLCAIADRLFNLLANPREVTFGDEGSRLPLSLEEASGTTQVTAEQWERLRKKWAWRQSLPQSIGLPTKPWTAPGGTRRRVYRFDETTTQAITKACKAKNISVSSALFSALIEVTVNKRVPSRQKASGTAQAQLPMTYTSSPFFDLRPHFPKSSRSKDDPFTVLIISDPLSVKVSDSFVENAAQVQNFYSRGGANVLADASGWMKLHGDVVSGKLPRDFAAPAPPESLALGTPPTLNSLGVFERYIRTTSVGPKYTFDILNFEITVDVLGTTLLMYAWTIRGRLQLTPLFNETVFDAEYVQMILDAVVESLLRNLQIRHGETYSAKL